MPNWRALADAVDRAAVRTFDFGGVLFQKMANGVASGAAVPVPAEFDGAFKSLQLEDGGEAPTMQPTAWVHYADFPPGVRPEEEDRLAIPAGPFAGVYAIAQEEPNGEGTGALLRLVRV
jgi:hypothetical protein